MLKTLYDICIVLILINALLGLYLWLRKQLGTKLYPIVLALSCSVIEQTIIYYTKSYFQNSQLVCFIFVPIQYGCFAWFLSLHISYTNLKNVILASVAAFFVFTAAYAYFFWHLTPLARKLILDDVAMAKGILLTVWAIVYFKSIFNHISQFKKLNVSSMILVAGILFYFAFSAMFHLAFNYLIRYSLKHNVFINDMLKSETFARLYALKHLYSFYPLLYLTNILLYLCVFVALLNKNKPAKSASLLAI